MNGENLWAFRYRGLIGIVLLIPAGVVTIFSRPAVAAGSGLDMALSLAGWAAFFSGAALRIWATLYVGCRKRSTLVVEGPYSVCRNPLYLGTFLLSLAAGLFLESALFTAAVCLVILAYSYATVPCEEKFLRETHGEAYDRYCRSVARFWPRFAGFHTPETVEVKVHGLRIEIKRLCAWIWLPFLAQLVSQLRVKPWWPAIFPGF
jgi:protein-S-isoprenylcysteine O-methyltransferase Ste14